MMRLKRKMRHRCPLCGEETANLFGNYQRYGLCPEHSEMFKRGIIELCYDCGNWHYSNEECECHFSYAARKYHRNTPIEDSYEDYDEDDDYDYDEEDEDYNEEELFGKPQENFNEINEEDVDFRKRFPAKYRCDDGHYVRSSFEQIIDNYLFEKRIWHVYEKRYISLTNQQYFPDFYLPEYNLYIEYFGVENNKQKNEAKKELFLKDKKNHFAFIYPEQQGILKEVLEDIIKHHKKKEQSD
jgi:hypothetical protein